MSVDTLEMAAGRLEPQIWLSSAFCCNDRPWSATIGVKNLVLVCRLVLYENRIFGYIIIVYIDTVPCISCYVVDTPLSCF